MPSETLYIGDIGRPVAIITERDSRWAQVIAKDASADGLFWYSVATTGVYCRPSCPARLARPANVKFHTSPGHARAAGFRACLRCRPGDERNISHQRAEIVAHACKQIEEAPVAPSLAELAAIAGLSESYFHRLFKAQTGLTPKAYATARRASRLRRSLTDGESVTHAIFDAGFNSSSRVYEKTDRILGMRPREFKFGGRGTVIYFAVGQCSLGAILVASTAKGVCTVSLGDEPQRLVEELQKRFPEAEILGGNKGYEKLVAQVVGLVENPELGCSLPLDIRGTAFQQRVWEALRQIPPGSTASYSEIAQAVGQPGAVRAVARACGANKLAVAIPCHRVVRSDGSLSGYRWGVERKRALLQRENAGAGV